jgi:hypothetical protein
VIVLEEIVVILKFGQVFAHELAHEFKKLIELIVAQPRDQNSDEFIVAKGLKIELKRTFIYLPR